MLDTNDYGYYFFFWQPFDVTELNISNRLQPVSLTHPFGTDHFGRDMLSMIMVGAQTSIAVAFVAVGIGVLFGVPLGLFAANWRGGFIDDGIMRFNDLVFAFPSLVIAILITAIAGPSAFNAIVAIGIFNIPVFARISRGLPYLYGNVNLFYLHRLQEKLVCEFRPNTSCPI